MIEPTLNLPTSLHPTTEFNPFLYYVPLPHCSFVNTVGQFQIPIEEFYDQQEVEYIFEIDNNLCSFKTTLPFLNVLNHPPSNMIYTGPLYPKITLFEKQCIQAGFQLPIFDGLLFFIEPSNCSVNHPEIWTSCSIYELMKPMGNQQSQYIYEQFVTFTFRSWKMMNKLPEFYTVKLAAFMFLYSIYLENFHKSPNDILFSTFQWNLTIECRYAKMPLRFLPPLKVDYFSIPFANYYKALSLDSDINSNITYHHYQVYCGIIWYFTFYRRIAVPSQIRENLLISIPAFYRPDRPIFSLFLNLSTQYHGYSSSHRAWTTKKFIPVFLRKYYYRTSASNLVEKMLEEKIQLLDLSEYRNKWFANEVLEYKYWHLFYSNWIADHHAVLALLENTENFNFFIFSESFPIRYSTDCMSPYLHYFCQC